MKMPNTTFDHNSDPGDILATPHIPNKIRACYIFGMLILARRRSHRNTTHKLEKFLGGILETELKIGTA